MSTTLSTTDMVAQLQQRIPMGLSNAYCMQQLNKAYRWVEQQGAFTWNIAYADILVRAGTFWVDPDDMPDRFDPGKPCSIYALSTSDLRGAPIPYKQPEQIQYQQLFHSRVPPGAFSCFTVMTNLGDASVAPDQATFPDEVPFILFAPSLGSVTTNTGYHCIYHLQPNATLAEGADVYFPTPDAFDDMYVDLAEGEIKRLYQFSMWADAQQKAQNSALLLLDKYRSPREELAGLTEQAKETQESQLRKAQ